MISSLLLRKAVNPRIGETPISDKPLYFDSIDQVDDLDEMVTSFERTAPVVVFARNDNRFKQYGGDFAYQEIVERAARRTAGMALIIVANERVANELTDRWGREFGVYNGAFRIYARDVDPAVAETAKRHRYVTADRYMRSVDAAASQVGRIVGPQSALRRPPESFATAKAQLDTDRSGAVDVAKLQRDLEAARDEVISARQERELLLMRSSTADQLQSLLDHALKLLIRADVYDVFDDDGRGGFAEVPPQTCGESVDRANRFLSDRLVIHPEALRGAKQMDKGQWPARAWSGFRALHTYGSYMAENPQARMDFSDWAEKFGASTGWKPGDIAKGETGAVKGNSKFMRARMFPIDTAAVESGETEMLAHLKVQKRGGNDIPRIYFVWSQLTQKVHIGFFGPHELVPNTKS
ncbi:hypothetical protein ASH04_22350 [Rhodococcus sp. Leaf233]|nr:hypothetical protein ASH04_22350 [Rhodococcus sp. Leaf233]